MKKRVILISACIVLCIFALWHFRYLRYYFGEAEHLNFSDHIDEITSLIIRGHRYPFDFSVNCEEAIKKVIGLLDSLEVVRTNAPINPPDRGVSVRIYNGNDDNWIGHPLYAIYFFGNYMNVFYRGFDRWVTLYFVRNSNAMFELIASLEEIL